MNVKNVTFTLAIFIIDGKSHHCKFDLFKLMFKVKKNDTFQFY